LGGDFSFRIFSGTGDSSRDSDVGDGLLVGFVVKMCLKKIF
jgi:hypothetical protein